MEVTREDQHGGLKGRRESRPECCKQSPDGRECEQHKTQRIYTRQTWYLGRSKADRDES